MTQDGIRFRTQRLAGILMVGLAVLGGGGPAVAADDASTVVVTEVGDRLVDFSSVPVEAGSVESFHVGVTDEGEVVWYDDAGAAIGAELRRFDLAAAGRVSGNLVLAGDELWILPRVGGRLEAPVPFESWGALPAPPLRDIAGHELRYFVAGRDRINAYDHSSHPSVDEVVPEKGDPVLLAEGGNTALTGDGLYVEFLSESGGGADFHQRVTWVVSLDGIEAGSPVGVEPQACADTTDGDRVECAAVVVFPHEAVLFDPFGARISTVFRPSPGRTLTSVDSGSCNVIFATEVGASSGAVLKVVPSWRDPGCFADVPWGLFHGDIQWLGREGVTKGCNPPANDLFCPDRPVTRGEMAALLSRAFDLRDRADDPFLDDQGEFEADIERLAAAGVTKGCDPPQNDRFCPERLVTRQEMAAFIVRAAGYADDGAVNHFLDDDASPFEAEIDRLATAAVTRGCNPPLNDHFCPDDFVTRQELAAFLHRALSG